MMRTRRFFVNTDTHLRYLKRWTLGEEKHLGANVLHWLALTVKWSMCVVESKTGALKTTSRANGATIKSFSINVIAFSLSLYTFFSASELLPNPSHSISIYYPPPFTQSSRPILPFSHLQASTIAIKDHFFPERCPSVFFSPRLRAALSFLSRPHPISFSHRLCLISWWINYLRPNACTINTPFPALKPVYPVSQP